MVNEKKQLWIVLLIAVIAVSVMVILNYNHLETDDLIGQATKAKTYCTDSDGGLEYTTLGAVSGGTLRVTGEKYTRKWDSCFDEGHLYEWFCSDTTHAKYEDVVCANVVGAGSSCEEGVCTAAKSCEDTDNMDITVRGTVTMTEGGSTGKKSDECADDTTVEEWYCSGDGNAKSQDKPCNSGYVCDNGACVEEEKTCTDSDEDTTGNGMQQNVYGTVTVTQGGATIDSKEDSCTSDKTAVNEAYCSRDGKNTAKAMEKTCASGYVCDEGACEAEAAAEVSAEETDLLFRLRDFSGKTVTWEDGYKKIITLTEESSYERSAKKAANVFFVEYDGEYTLYFKSSTNEDSGKVGNYLLFIDSDESLEPSEEISIKATVRTTTNYQKTTQYIVGKTTATCGKPLYALMTKNKYYHFLISINDKPYDLVSTTTVSGNSWQEVEGVYSEAGVIRLYVNGDLEDEEYVSYGSKISTTDYTNGLFIGQRQDGENGYCDDDYSFTGHLYDIEISGH